MISKKDKSIFSIAHLRAIFEEMEKFDITHLVINRNGESYEIQRGKNSDEPVINSKLHVDRAEDFEMTTSEKSKVDEVPPKPHTKGEHVENTQDDKNIVEIKTPTVGTYYSCPTPDSEPFVHIGKRILKGDTLCIVEAMKSMNEIESEVDGTITEILVENMQMVEYDQALFKIKVES